MTHFPAGERVVHKAVTVAAPVEDVWWSWTTDAGIRSWLVDDSRIELRVGGPYEWYFLADAAQGSRGSEDCQVIGFQAPTMLTVTWNAPPHLAEARAQRTVVLLRLRADDAGEGTHVEVTQLGWGDGGEWDEAYEYFDAAWGRVLDRLRAYFAGEEELPDT
jgi:uncharacterized protein YndB with AHSA1/START domain